ncbi:helix-turn-helix domain-containing protein [Nocardioides sp.]|uniref:helix-turn-helix domain-containing protein n=1 Tax=Nocardioides sp. TaxID=35761 RepID=UPI00271B399D|nr:helix-turn-helix domain-containing protein [Nocardioides sp.]MDO9457036.1 helix-turn-helix domain-containing protein [Nocardioides sp.]
METSREPAQVTPDLRVRAKNIDAVLVGTRIKLARQRAGLTQGEAAGDHMSTAYISRIEAGQRRASADLLVALANRLDCDPEELLAPDEDVAAREHFDRLTLELDYAELDLRTGQAEEALTRVDALLAESDVPTSLTVKARFVRGQALESIGQLTTAIKTFEDLLTLSTDALFRIRALLALSRCYREEGDLARACEIGERASVLVSAADLEGSAEGIQLAVTVAAAHFERGDVNFALRMCERAVESAERLESPMARASAYWNSSIVHQRQGNITDALPLAHKAVVLLEQTHDARSMARLRNQLGLLQLQMDPPQVDESLANLERARVDMEFNDASTVDLGRNQLGRARCRLLIGDAEEAERLAEDCFQSMRETSLMLSAEALTVLGQIAATRGEVDTAVGRFQRALVVLEGVGADREAAQLWFELANLLREYGAVDQAMEAFRKAGASTGLTPSSIPTARVAPTMG